jgi:phenylacetate-CoA ligase
MTTSVTIWDRSAETLQRDDLQQVQLERLQASLFRAYRNVSFYRKRFDALGVAPEDVSTLADLRRLPFTTKDDLRNGYPYDLLAVPLREVVRLHHTSWVTGRPTVCAFTRNDLRAWHDRVARWLSAAGVTHDDVVQLFFDEGARPGNLGFLGGAERIGASVIPAGIGTMAQQVAIMQDFRTTALVGSASAAAHLAHAMSALGIDRRRLSARVAVLGGGPWSEAQRASIETALGITALDHYGLSEVGGPGVAGECAAKCGLHLAEDHFLAEIVDPATGAPVPDGEEGELVLTTLTKEALPLIRFRTHDLTRFDPAPCACGRTSVRLARITRRTDGVLTVQGRKLDPTQVAALLTEIEGAAPRYCIVLDRKAGVEETELLVELLPALNVDSPGKVLALEGRIQERLQSATGLTPRVRLVESATLDKMTDGAGNIVDRRG